MSGMPTPADGYYPHEKGLKGLPGAPQAERTKGGRFAVTAEHSTMNYATKIKALQAAKELAAAKRGCTILDRRTGMYLDTTTGEPLPAEHQVTR